ncbi:hypothetical protein LTR66_003322 [Elasticomyces elasticus]|nr:hypothetical protein LTR50_000899 [Elasticomyces elasticus]KAK4997237.1 hypothetical protein LTR66_003322 [Elasticomyces elasticus]
MSKALLITGATGRQGGSVIDALLSSPSASDFTILAVTRNPDSPSAKSLASRSDLVKIVKGDFNDVQGMFKSAKATHPQPVWGVFSVQVPMGKGATPGTEEQQGKAIVDEAIAQGVKKFVYTSVDRHGDDSYNNPTDVPHFISKHNIEHHLVDKTAGSSMDWTILRPVAFMDNMSPNFFGKMFNTAWKVGLPENCKLQFVSCHDIGYFAAQAFIKPEKYSKKAISLAGDDLTFEETNKIFQEKAGHPLPTTFGFMGSGLLWGVKEMGIMFKFFKHPGYGADIKKLREEHPGLLNFGDWLEKKSKFQLKH